MKIKSVFLLMILFAFVGLSLKLAPDSIAAQSAMPPDVYRSAAGFHPFSGREKQPVATIRDLIREISRRHTWIRKGGKVTQPFFTVRGRILKVKGAEIQAYEYRSAKTARKEADAVHGSGTTVGTSSINWIAPPHFFRSGRLIALYVGDDRSVLELLESILGSQFNAVSLVPLIRIGPPGLYGLAGHRPTYPKSLKIVPYGTRRAASCI